MGFDETFELVRRLGEGAAGEVHLARRKADGLEVAVKFTSASSTLPQERERFAEEVRYLTQIRSPFVVQVYGAGVREKSLYYVMEYVEGKDLATFMAQRGALEPRDALGLIGAIAAGLGAIHKVGVVHRDLKPANVMLTAQGKPKLADFGLAKGHESSVRTKTGLILGTPGYISPEQFGGKKATPASDVYALGAMFYALLCGRRLFEEEDLGDVIRAQMAGPDEEDLELVPPQVRVLLETMIALDPAGRPTPEEIVAEVKRLREQLTREPVATRAMDASKSGSEQTIISSETRLRTSYGHGATPPSGRQMGIPASAGRAGTASPAPVPSSSVRVILGVGGFLVLALIGLVFSFTGGPAAPPAPAGPSPRDQQVAGLVETLAACEFGATLEGLEKDGRGLPSGSQAAEALAAELVEHLESAGVYRSHRALAELVDESFWRELPAEGEPLREALRLRRNLLRELLVLERWNQLLFYLTGSDEPFDRAERMRRPVLRFALTDPPPETPGDKAKGAYPVKIGCDSPGTRRDNRRCSDWIDRMNGQMLTPLGPSEEHCYKLMKSGDSSIPQCLRVGDYPVPSRSGWGKGDWWVVSLGVAFLDKAELLHVVVEGDEPRSMPRLAGIWHPAQRDGLPLMPPVSLAEVAFHSSLLKGSPRNIRVIHDTLGWPAGGQGDHWYSMNGIGLRRQTDYP